MQVFPLQLESELKKGLKPIYVLAGTEFVLQIDARDSILSVTREANFGHPEIHYEDEVSAARSKSGFWTRIFDDLSEGSLFGSKNIVEVRTTAKQFGSTDWPQVKQYMTNPSETGILLVWLSDLDYVQKRATWYSELRNDKNLVLLISDELNRSDFSRWVNNLAKKLDFQLTELAIEKLSDYCEGNLLAVKHEIDTIGLTVDEGATIEAEQLNLMDSSVSDTFEIIDAVCDGNVRRVEKLLDSIGRQTEWKHGTVIGLLRMVSNLLSNALGSLSTTNTRKMSQFQMRRLEKITRRFNKAQLSDLLIECAQLNSMILGMSRGNQPELLMGLLFSIAGYAKSTLEHDYHWRMIDRAH